MSVRDTGQTGEMYESTPPRVTMRVWELPVRITHWVIFLSVIVLSVTGFYIGNPFISTGSDPRFLMGTVRSIHVVSAWVMIAAVMARILWAFTGNRWAHWDQFIPVGGGRRKTIGQNLKYYLLLRRDIPKEIGHNPLAGITYTVVYLMFLVQIVTGLALTGLDNPGGILSNLTGWVFGIGSIPAVRFTHHIIMWLTWGFIIHHVYSAVLVDTEEKNGLLSSIFSGRKEVEKDLL
ncbi:MAG TPA: Ni/Fe-hydrogenase, b-type cytochrome subunit [Acidimicrobiia bacterium]|jgi:Ni/Fe-hydrogenase 1 B-type cytochrome subunit